MSNEKTQEELDRLICNKVFYETKVNISAYNADQLIIPALKLCRSQWQKTIMEKDERIRELELELRNEREVVDFVARYIGTTDLAIKLARQTQVKRKIILDKEKL